jgi:hypothetical protein
MIGAVAVVAALIAAWVVRRLAYRSYIERKRVESMARHPFPKLFDPDAF